MATLQTIRSKGPLLVIVLGLALFAFIAGDAWRVLQPHQGPRDIGEVNGETISAYEFQLMLDEYTDIIKFTSGNNSLTDEQLTQVKDEVWRNYVNNKLIEKEAKKLGLTVSNAEVEAIIEAGTNPLLQQTPFRNPQTGAFDKDMLKMFLVEYAKMDRKEMPQQYIEYYDSMNTFWNFIEKNLIQARLAEKYQALIANSVISNPIEAQNNFDNRANQYDMLLAAVPYTSVPDSTVKVTDADLKKAYDSKKEQYKQYVETRNIKYIDVQVLPSNEDKTATQDEVADYANQLEESNEYASIVRSSGSVYPYADVLYSKSAFPTDVTNLLDSATIGEVYGPYYNQADDSYNAFKIVSRQAAPDSVEYRQIQVYAENDLRTRMLADSIYDALKGGANFEQLAEQYSIDGSAGEPTWLSSQNYENAILDIENTNYINTIMSLPVKGITNLSIGEGNVIIEVLNRKGIQDKYKVAVIKRPIQFSKETYNKAYNNFSQFIAANNTAEKIAANAENEGYRLLERSELYSSEHQIGGIKGTKEALRWIFDEAKTGEVSPLYEVGDNDRMLVVTLEGVNKEGYRPLNAVKELLRPEVIKEKKAEKLLAELKSTNVSTFDNARSIPNVLTDSIKHVSFSAPAYVSLTRSSEPALGAYASVAESNKVAGPVKGNGGIYFLQVYNKEAINETYDQTKEESTLKSMSQRSISRYMNDLYTKGNVKDLRYLAF